MLKRKIEQRLIDWKNDPEHKPLIIKGCRQCGKTYSVLDFAKKNYAHVVYLNFFENPDYASVFSGSLEPDNIVMMLSALLGKNAIFETGKTVLILDEIQDAPRVLESLKYFCEDAPEYHVLAAGSLLGVAIHQGVSYPVGKVELLDLYPLNFREFLCAMGEEALSGALDSKDFSIIDNFSDKYLFWLKNYYYTGGMPAVVDLFREQKDYAGVRELQKDIVRQYRGDFGKHIDAKDLPRIRMVWESIPIQLAKENKKFFFGQIKKGARSADFEIAIQWLLDCGLIYKVNRVNEPHVPLAAYKEMNVYKLFVLDVGLLGAMSDLDAMSILEGNDIFVEFKGALTEQYVLQQIISDTKYTPYYYGTEKATFEQDFMIQMGKDVVPIEVKAETNLKSQSLKCYCEKYHPQKAIRFSAKKYIDQGWMKNVPLYAVCTL